MRELPEYVSNKCTVGVNEVTWPACFSKKRKKLRHTCMLTQRLVETVCSKVGWKTRVMWVKSKQKGILDSVAGSTKYS